MEANKSSVREAFVNSRLLRIPFFQRPYVWGEENWERFAEDMYSLVVNQRNYFIGALILKKEDVNSEESAYGIYEKWSVVDGQQRLTTLLIFLKVLYLLTGKNAEFDTLFRHADEVRSPVLRHSFNDREIFNRIMNVETPTKSFPGYDDKNVAKAYNYFLNDLLRKQEGEDKEGNKDESKKLNLRALLNAISAHLHFVEIRLGSDDNEKEIFETINSLGVDLTTDELLKNFLYTPNEEKEYINEWKPAFDDDDVREFWKSDDAPNRKEKTDKTKVIDTFLYYVAKIQMWKYKSQLSESDRKRFVLRSETFNAYKKFVNKFGENRLELAREIIEYSKLYRKYFDKAKRLDTRIPAASSIERLVLYAMVKENTIAPYLLYILRNVTNTEEQIGIFDYLEKYLIRRVVSMSVKSNANYVEQFSETLIKQNLDTLDKLKSYIGKIPLTAHHAMPTDDMIDSGVYDIKLDSDTAKLVLYFIETRHVYKEGLGYNQYEIDAIMPKPSKKNEKTWPPKANEIEEDLRKKRTQNIGNYLLLLNDDTDNPIKVASNKDKSWNDKKPLLKQWSNGVRTSQGFANVNRWNEESIKERNKQIAETVKKLYVI